jgi:hypothetical protein
VIKGEPIEDPVPEVKEEPADSNTETAPEVQPEEPAVTKADVTPEETAAEPAAPEAQPDETEKSE